MVETQILARIDLKDCPRCGTNHRQVAVMPLQRPGGGHTGATHHGKCPVTKEPFVITLVRGGWRQINRQTES